MSKITEMYLRTVKAVFFFILITKQASGQSIFIHQQDVELTIPIMKESFYALDVYPIIQLKFTDLQGNATDQYKFMLKRSPEFLRINEMTGEIFFQREKWYKQRKVKNLKAVVKKIETGSIALTSLTFNFVNAVKKQFCIKRSCFYDKIQYFTSEFNLRKGNEEQVIGDINPSLYHRICDPYETFYYFVNGTDIASLSRKNQLIKLIRLDYDQMTNHNISIDITCELKDERLQDVAIKRRFLNITIVDRNDNLVYVDDESMKVDIYRTEREFREGDLVNRSVVVIFRDFDSLEANRQVEIKMSKSHQMFSSQCSSIIWPDLENNLSPSAFICDIYFSRDGQLDQPRYCFQLQAFDTTIKKKQHASSHVCVITVANLTLTEVSAITNSPTQEQQSSEIIEILYPKEVQVLQSASRFARVVQPLSITVGEEGEEFSLTSNPFGAFNITPTDGIIFIMRPNLLAHAHPASTIKLEVSWKEQQHQINVILKPETSHCSNLLTSTNPIDDFCARHDSQESCEISCGVGSKNGRCKWRPHEGSELMSKVFSTCVPDLDFCSNHECDSLEELGSSLGFHICPQDCSHQVFGTVGTKSVGISGSSKENVCTCDEFEDCSCGPAVLRESEVAITTKTSITIVDQNLTGGIKCGDQCLAMLILVPSCVSVIIFILFVFLIASRHWRVPRNSIEAPNLYESHFIRSPTTSAEFEEQNESQDQQGHPDFYSRRWEINIKRFKVERTIGEGEFGKVLLASLKRSNGEESTPVVIKTVKNIGNDSEMTSLKKEFEQLQKVSVRAHPNVITLLGCYSKGTAPLIFLEFCVFESLKNYLLASRLIPLATGTEGVDKVTLDDILNFSSQIVRGMSHLSQLKLVHRDLAARNVLLFEGKICKISDFGLTRNVCNSCDVYSKCSDDKVPVKWLAPESLSSSEEYTTKSDVWAFGILGYELIMLGSSPYPNIAANHKEILNLLINGCRMQRPPNCSQELFSVFESCWSLDPSFRPTFEDLSLKFQVLTDINLLSNHQTLWTTPEYSEAESQDYNAAYSRDYINRTKRYRLMIKNQQTKKKALNRKRSNAGELLTSKSLSTSLIPAVNPAKTLKVSRSMTHFDNAGYDGNFDSIKSLMLTQNVDQNVSDLTTASTSTCSSYLPMKPIQVSSSLESSSDIKMSSSIPNINTSGYIAMREKNHNTHSSSSESSTLEASFSS